MNWTAIGTPDASPRIPVPLTAEEIGLICEVLRSGAVEKAWWFAVEHAALLRLADSIERRGK